MNLPPIMLQDNSTMNATVLPQSNASVGKSIVMIFFVFGVFGNFLALVILSKKKNTKNSKYTLMLRWLTSNNLIGLVGMLSQMTLLRYLPQSDITAYARWHCVARVVWRFFGLSSGCIAVVMAAERWMALARPFTYHKHITYNVVKRTIQMLISIASVLTFLPLTGFGVYYDEAEHKCLRYRDATTFLDMAYAYIFMIFGTLLCTIIVVCNLFVVRALCYIGYHKSKKSIHYNLVSRERNFNNSSSTTITNATTASTSTAIAMNPYTNNPNDALIGGNIESGVQQQQQQPPPPYGHHHAPSLSSCHTQGTTISSSCSSFGSRREAIARAKSNASSSYGHGALYHQSSISNTEKNFAKLMTFLSISFVICWMPQMISVPLALMPNRLPTTFWFFKMADILMALHFTSDPYIYVISRTKYSFIRDCIKHMRGASVKRKRSDQNRLRTNIETLDYGLNS